MTDFNYARYDRMQKTLEDVQYVSAHGGLTGDCPHYTSAECFESLTKYLMETAAAARAALSVNPEEEHLGVGEPIE